MSTAKATVRGSIVRPSYTGNVTFYQKDGETTEQAIARTLSWTSFSEGVSASDIIVHSVF